MSGVSPTDEPLQAGCRLRAREGLWLLVHRALSQGGWARDNALDMIGVIAPERIGMIRDAIDAR